MTDSDQKTDLRYLKRHLETIAICRDPFKDPDQISKVQAYIETTLSDYGYSVRTQPFIFENKQFENVIAGAIDSRESSRTANSGNEKLIIGAHFDAVVDSPGADDNASGVAALLEIARVLSSIPQTGKHYDIEFAAFNLEEYNMIGSTVYVNQMDTYIPEKTRMISLEMLGYISNEKGSQKLPLYLKPFYPNTGNFIALVGDKNSRTFLDKASNAFKRVPNLPVQTLTVPNKGHLLPETRLSDHSPFWDKNIPALLITDTSFFRNPHYHTPNDTLQTLNLAFIQKVCEGVIELIVG